MDRSPHAHPHKISGIELPSIVEELCQAKGGLIRRSDLLACAEPLPSRNQVNHIVELLRSVIFPGHFGASDLRPDTLRFHLGHTLDELLHLLRVQIRRGLAFDCTADGDIHTHDADAQAITVEFLKGLAEIQHRLAYDVQAAYEGDPAAHSTDETIFCYPGVHAVTNYRIAHYLQQLGVPLLPRMITEYAHSVTGIDIHPGAQIGDRFFIDHGTGVVVGETCIIGDRVRIYQGVTLGAKSFPLDEEGKPVKGIPRHPIIEDDVIIYSGATILGRVTVGQGAVIGGNVWLTRSVPAGAKITLQPPRQEIFQEGAGI